MRPDRKGGQGNASSARSRGGHCGRGCIGWLAATVLGLSSCGAPYNSQVGADGEPTSQQIQYELVADEAVFPDVPGQTLAAVTRDDEMAGELFDDVGFDADVPSLEAEESLVVLSGGESGGCPWELDALVLDDDGSELTAELGQHEQECTDDWNPRSLGFVVHEPDVDADTTIRVSYRDQVHEAGPWAAGSDASER